MEKQKPFFFKMHQCQGRMILAACDASLMGKVLCHGKGEGKAEFDICPEFYGREKADAAQIAEMTSQAHTCNFVGKYIIDALAQAGVIRKENAIMIGGKVPHVQTFSL